MTDQSFPRSSRLLTAGDYRLVFNGTQIRLPHRQLLLLATSSQTAKSRVGLIFSKKNTRLAVQRNRLKRLTREVFRQERLSLPALDIVVLGRQGIGNLDNASYVALLRDAFGRLRRKATSENVAKANAAQE